MRSEKYKGMLRLHCLMGRQALLDAIERTRITTNLCREYSSELPDLEARMAAAAEKNGAIKKELYDLKKDIQAKEAEALRPLLSEKPLFRSYDSMSSEDLQAVAHILEKAATPPAESWSRRTPRYIRAREAEAPSWPGRSSPPMRT